MPSVPRASASRDPEPRGENFPRESFWNSWVPGLVEFILGPRIARTRGLARDTRATVSGLVAVGDPLPVIIRFFQREALDDGFVAESLAQPVDRLFGLGGAAIEQVGEIRSLAVIER
jgi:hypothetical protein